MVPPLTTRNGVWACTHTHTQQVSTQQKDLQGALVKLGKGIEKTDGVDLEGALRDSQFDQDTLNTVVAQHLLREGNFELASAFVQEARITMPAVRGRGEEGCGGEGVKRTNTTETTPVIYPRTTLVELTTLVAFRGAGGRQGLEITLT